MQNKLEELKKAIHEACPELLELSFGCEIEYDGLKYKIINEDSVEIGSHIYFGFFERMPKYLGKNEIEIQEDMTRGWRTCGCDTGNYVKKIKYIKILGHHIGIAEVLRAINKVDTKGDSIGITESGLFFRAGALDVIYTEIYWDLEHDDLDWPAKNKTEVIDFLYSIICK